MEVEKYLFFQSRESRRVFLGFFFLIADILNTI